MTLSGSGNPVDDNTELSRRLPDAPDDGLPEYEDVNHRGTRMLRKQQRMLMQEDLLPPEVRSQAYFYPRAVDRRKRVSLTHFQRGFSRRRRRKEEGSLIRPISIREAGNDILGSRVPGRRIRRGRNANRRYKKYKYNWHYPGGEAGAYQRRMDWTFEPSLLMYPVGGPESAAQDKPGGCQPGHSEPCTEVERGEIVPPPAKTYTVELQPADDEEEGPTVQQQLPLCNKFYYIFDKMPFKVKFLNFLSSPGKCSDQASKLSMPAFNCIPPECREVVWCKYFQCKSLGFFPDTKNYRKYFFCDLNSNGFVLYHMLCPRGRIFDPVIRECRLEDIMKREMQGHAQTDEEEASEGKDKKRIKKDEPDKGELIQYKEDGATEGAGDGKKPEESPKAKEGKDAGREGAKKSAGEEGAKQEENANKGKGAKQGEKARDDEDTSKKAPKEKSAKTEKNGKEEGSRGEAGKEAKESEDTRDTETGEQKEAKRNSRVLESGELFGRALEGLDLKNFTPLFTIPKCPFNISIATKLVPIPVVVNFPDLFHTSKPAETTSPLSIQHFSLPLPTMTMPTKTTMDTTTLATRATSPPTKSEKATLPICPPPPPPPKQNFTYPSNSPPNWNPSYADSGGSQYGSQEDDYSDYYYDGQDGAGNWNNYEWLKQSLYDYLEKMKKEGNNQGKVTQTGNQGQSTSPPLDVYNGNPHVRALPMGTETNTFPPYETDRGKRSEDNTSETSSTERAQTKSSGTSEALPDFEISYQMRGTNLDGYPCKQYGRYPDKFDRLSYYECGAQPDGLMKIEHKHCPNGEEFSPEYLECIATEYLRVVHRKRRMPELRKKQKNEPKPQDENYEDERELPNEWIDETHGTKLPNEFKSKGKNRLRIFHLQNKRNSSDEKWDTSPGIRSGLMSKGKDQRHNVRSYIIRTNVKEAQDEEAEEDDDDEEDEDDEEYDDDVEVSSHLNDESFAESSTTAGASPDQQSSTDLASNKVLLDADITVNRDFEKALKNFLGKGRDEEVHRKREGKDSLVIQLSGDRVKRNFLKGLFSKKSKLPEDEPEKEGVVSMLTLINGLPSEYERDAILQKLERRKMMNSHLGRTDRLALRKRKRKIDREIKYSNRSKTERENTQLQNNR